MRIRVYENGAYQDEEAVYTLGDDYTPAEALARCRAMVDADLGEVYASGMSATELLAAYRMFGRDPVIVGDCDPQFSAWAYAQVRAAEMIGVGTKDASG